MKAKKETIDKAIANGSFAKIDRILSASHILTEMSDYLTSEADDIARDNNLMLGEVKQMQTNYSKVHDRYCLFWRDLVRESNQIETRTVDFDHFLPIICRLLSLDDIVTDPNTGRSCRETWEKKYPNNEVKESDFLKIKKEEQ